MTTIFENQCTYTYEYYLQLEAGDFGQELCKHMLQRSSHHYRSGCANGGEKLVYLFTIAAVVALIFVLYRLIGTPIRLASFAAKKNRQVHGRDIETINHFYRGSSLGSQHPVTGQDQYQI